MTHSRTSAGGTSSQATRVAWGKKLCGQAGHCPPPWVVEIQGGGPQYPGLQTNPLRCQLLGLPPWILHLPNTPSSVLTPFPPLYSLCPAAPGPRNPRISLHPPWRLFFLQQPFLPAPLSNAPRGVLQGGRGTHTEGGQGPNSNSGSLTPEVPVRTAAKGPRRQSSSPSCSRSLKNACHLLMGPGRWN